ncbi:MAG: hypothetical protein JKY65_30030 [Planctomycetes bacterium]|nr:hypothetical protein [Planctomycetota bacterium]
MNHAESDAAGIAVLSQFIADVVTHAGGKAKREGATLTLDLGEMPVEVEVESPPLVPTPVGEVAASSESGEASSQAVAATRAATRDTDAPEKEDESASGEEAGEDAAEDAAEADEPESPVSKVVPGSIEDLARRLRRTDFELVFRSEDLTPGRDLVADGSPLIHRLEEFLAEQGSRCYVVAPATARLSLKALDAAAEAAAAEEGAPLDRASLGLLAGKGERVRLEDREDALGYDLYVLYRIRIRALEREDRSVCVRVEIRPGVAPDEAIDVTACVLDPPAEVADWVLKGRRRLPEAVRPLGLKAADTCLAGHARQAATEIQTKLRHTAQDDLKRLHAYYAGQIAEYMRRKSSDINLIRIEELEAERELRITELIRSAEVRVGGEALSTLVVERPIQRARAVRRSKDEDEGEEELASRWLLFDRSRGTVEWEGEV